MGAVAVGLAGTATRGTGWDGTAVSERRKTSGFDVEREEGRKAGPRKDEPAHYVAFRPFGHETIVLFLALPHLCTQSLRDDGSCRALLAVTSDQISATLAPTITCSGINSS